MKRRRSARSYVLEVLLLVAFFLVMVTLVLPAAARYLTTEAQQQFMPSQELSS